MGMWRGGLVRDILFEFNPNHDMRGRFATAAVSQSAEKVLVKAKRRLKGLSTASSLYAREASSVAALGRMVARLRGRAEEGGVAGRIAMEILSEYDESQHARDERGRWTTGQPLMQAVSGRLPKGGANSGYIGEFELPDGRTVNIHMVDKGKWQLFEPKPYGRGETIAQSGILERGDFEKAGGYQASARQYIRRWRLSELGLRKLSGHG